MNMRILGMFLVFNLFAGLIGQTFGATGSIVGKVLDAETQTPLIGANIILVGSTLGAASDLAGNYLITNVPVGSYTLQFSYVGYQSTFKADVIVKSQRHVTTNAQLKMILLESESVTVSAGYFIKSAEQPTGVVNFSSEEIRRAPGSAGDVSRIMMSLPSVAKVNDQSNNLIVRGGNPVENTFFVDNIEIPNINHFPDQASSGGPIGILNVDFIQDVSFYSGGFAVTYGDKLSSVMDISFREGNRNEFDGQLDLNMTGFGGVAEGPLYEDKGSWLFSVRRSYLDFVVKMFNVGTTVAPTYGDYQAKIVYDINSKHKITLLGIYGDDHNAPDRKTAEENQMLHYGNQDLYEGTTGMNWRALWGTKGYSNTSFAYTTSIFSEDFYETSTGNYTIKNRSTEQRVKFRNMNHFRFNSQHSIEFGTDSKYFFNQYKNFYNAITNAIGDSIPALFLKENIHTFKFGAFMNYIVKPIKRLTLNLGLRTDYFAYNDNINISPRVSFSYQLNPKLFINSSIGLFSQNLPLLLLVQNEYMKILKDLKAVHYVLGVEHMLTESMKVTLEIYQKDYTNFPVDPLQPAIFPIDKGRFYTYENLLDQGRARTQGVEFIFQKKLAKDIYGLASFSFFKSQYKALDGVWRERDYDNQVTFSLEGGYKPNRHWEFSLRWIYAGGAPYTPIDIESSKIMHRDVLNMQKVNSVRYPDYHSMNIRFDRRFHFNYTNLILYLSAWNVYNRKNVATFYWNDKEQKQDVIYQWQLLPIFGIEYEF